MKIRILLSALLCCWQTSASAADLIEVYKQALCSDAVFQQAIAQRLSTKEGVPISVGALLPNLSLTANPAVVRTGYAGSSFLTGSTFNGSAIYPRNVTNRQYTLNLSLTQTVFNFAQFSTVAQQVALSQSADATLNAALQNLMIRVAAAYFSILEDEDNLSYADASKLAYAEQLDQIKQQYKVGLKTLTDVYTAQASYDTAVSTYILAETTLTNDRENLRVITGVYYPHISSLSDDFPLISPQPQNIEKWVSTAIRQNWSIRAADFNASAARQVIRQQFAGHLPTLNVQAQATRIYGDSINKYNSFSDRNGPGTQVNREVVLNLYVPLFSGGQVVAETNQAAFNYRIAQEQLEQTTRQTMNLTRQSYNSITAGISQVAADKQAIKSNISSLEGLEASYKVGTETLVDVLDQQQKVYQAQTQYAKDRYAFVNNILALKLSAGTLSFSDLCAINAWLIDKERTPVNRHAFKGHPGSTHKSKVTSEKKVKG